MIVLAKAIEWEESTRGIYTIKKDEISKAEDKKKYSQEIEELIKDLKEFSGIWKYAATK